MTTNTSGTTPGLVTPENDNGRNPLEQVAPAKTLSHTASNFIAEARAVWGNSEFPRFWCSVLLVLAAALTLGSCYAK